MPVPVLFFFFIAKKFRHFFEKSGHENVCRRWCKKRVKSRLFPSSLSSPKKLCSSVCAATVATGSSLSTTTFETFFSLLLLDDSNSKSIPNLVFTKAEFCSFFLKKRGKALPFFMFYQGKGRKKIVVTFTQYFVCV